MNDAPVPTSRQATAEGMRRLAAWAADAPAREPPEAVRRRAALILADDIGAMAVASREPMVAAAQAGLAASSGREEATIFARGASRADVPSAAAANGIAATWCELDEGFRIAPCHAGAYVLPALLASAEARNMSVGRVLTLLAVAYDVTTRLARAFPFRNDTVHPHAAFAAIGAATAASLARGHDASTLLGAVTGAATMAFAGPFRHPMDGAMVRNAWTSAGAWIGLRCAEWAELGITGIPESPHDVFAGGFATDVVPDELTAGLGEAWGVLGGYHKVYACCQYAHSAVEAGLALHARLGEGRTAADLENIVVETHPRGMALDAVEPPTMLAAKFSMPHAMAAIACLGTGGAAAFTDAARLDPAIADLRRRVRIAAHQAIGAPPNDRPARVVWRFRDGLEWTEQVFSARGGADRPFDEATLLDKLGETAGPVFPRMPARLRAIVAGDEASRSWAEIVADMTRADG
jgi:2-methylcitrate dehydratase PrpD